MLAFDGWWAQSSVFSILRYVPSKDSIDDCESVLSPCSVLEFLYDNNSESVNHEVPWKSFPVGCR